MRFLLRIIIACSLFFSGGIAHATDNVEIDYLLNHLAESGCTFVRNGKKYDAITAREHLEMKYNYAKKRIKTAEDFINKIASKSSMSRKPYEVHCGGIEKKAKQWWTDVLAAHRGQENHH